MLLTYLAVILMVLYVVITTIIFLPYLLVINEDKGIEVTSKLKRKFGRFVIWLIKARVEVVYEDIDDYKNIEKEPVLVISNHQSFVDIPLLLGYFPKSLGFVAKKEIRNWLIFNLWMDRAQCVFLDRRNPRKALSSMKEAMLYVKKGNSVVVFPEGTRSVDGNIGEFKKGSFKLATETGVRIIPVTIDGTYEIMNKHAFKIKRNGKIKLTVCRSYVTQGRSFEEVKNIHKDLRSRVVKKLRGI